MCLKRFDIKMVLSRERLQAFLHRCFSSEDDVFLDRMMSKSKDNANHMWRMPNDVAHPRRMDRAMFNFMVNILVGEDGPLTFAQANKRYSLHCLLLKKYMQSGDHHTALLLKQSLESPIMNRVQFKVSKSRLRSLKDSDERYGSSSNSFRHHLDDVVNDRLDYNEVASLLVCLIHKKRLAEYKKLVKKSSNVENALLRRFECYEGLSSYCDWMDIYVDDPSQRLQERCDDILNGSMNQKLFKIANKIRRRKTI